MSPSPDWWISFPIGSKTLLHQRVSYRRFTINGTLSHQRIEDSTRRWIFEDLKNECSTEIMFRPVSENVPFILTTPSRTKQQRVPASGHMRTLLCLSVCIHAYIEGKNAISSQIPKSYEIMISDQSWLDSVWHFPETPRVTASCRFWLSQGNCCLSRWSWVNPQEGEA